eukprot:9835209-Alexandrium_andersonii.AAC.1
MRSVSSRERATRSPPARAWTACCESVWMVTACGPKRRAWSAAQQSASTQAESSAASASGCVAPMNVGRRGSVATGPKRRC